MKRPRPTLAQVDELNEEIARRQALVDSFEAANIERQGKIESLQKQLQEQLDVNAKIREQLRTTESKIGQLEVSSEKTIVDYSSVDDELLREFALATLDDNYEGDDEESLRAQIEEAARFMPHAQQQILLDNNGVRRFRRNDLINRLVEESGKEGLIGLNYAFSIESSREDKAQLAQLIGYSVDGYQSLSYALPVKEGY